MDKKTLQDVAKRYVPAQHRGRNALTAFISGRALAVVAQLFIMLYMDMSDLDKDTTVSAIVVTMVLVTVLLTGFDVYDRAAQKCGVGLFIPISGLTSYLTSCVTRGRTEGPILGTGSNMFKLVGSVLTYGITAVLAFDTIRYLLFGV